MLLRGRGGIRRLPLRRRRSNAGQLNLSLNRNGIETAVPADGGGGVTEALLEALLGRRCLVEQEASLLGTKRRPKAPAQKGEGCESKESEVRKKKIALRRTARHLLKTEEVKHLHIGGLRGTKSGDGLSGSVPLRKL